MSANEQQAECNRYKRAGRDTLKPSSDHHRVYFKNAQGEYHYGLYATSLNRALRLAHAYRFVVPEVLVTNGLDYSVFESLLGVIMFPEGMRSVARNENCATRLPANDDDYLDLIDEQLWSKSVSEKEDIEVRLLAAAARDGIKLRDLLWQPLPELFEFDDEFEWTGETWVHVPPEC